MQSPAALQRRRDYAGPALLSYGFRPFFFAAGAWAVADVLLWLPQYFGEIALPSRFGPLDWHIHEMLYGYVAAAVAGFLLTAIPNWTGRLPVNGAPLAVLALLWFAGRIAILLSAQIGEAAAAAIDVAFLLVLAGVASREIMAGKNWRNLRVLVVLSVLIGGNVVFHAEVLYRGAADYGVRIGLAAIILLISLIGGRIVPSFTNNWLARNNPGRLPVPFSRYDVVTMAVSAFSLLSWIVSATHPITSVLLMMAGVMQFVRLARWAGDRTLRDRLVLVLHIGYGFVPLGFLLAGLAAFWALVPPSAGIHAWGAGAVALMTLAVMTRATLGHTGRPLAASAATQFIYACAFVAALLRLCAAFHNDVTLLHLSALAWLGAFGGFLLVYGPMLTREKPSWSEPRR